MKCINTTEYVLDIINTPKVNANEEDVHKPCCINVYVTVEDKPFAAYQGVVECGLKVIAGVKVSLNLHICDQFGTIDGYHCEFACL